MLTSALPAGSVSALRIETSFDTDRLLEMATARVLPALASGAGLGAAIEQFRPDLLLISSLFVLEALAVHLRHGLPMAFLTPNVRLHPRQEACRIDLARLFEMTAGTEELTALIRSRLPGVRSLDGLVRVMMAVPEMILIPRALEMPDDRSEPNAYYVGSCVSLIRCEQPLAAFEEDPGVPLVYCSLGSQSDLRRDVRQRFFREVLAAASSMPSRRFIVSVGPQTDLAHFQPPQNVSLVQWAPQLAVLKRAALMITHAGMGTVKECAIHGVPMLAFPVGRDQFAAARRIEYHRLGTAGDIECITASEIARMIEHIVGDAVIRSSVSRMRDDILREDADAASIDIFTTVLRAGDAAPAMSVRMASAGVS